jgi:enoyl-CoA hydratase
MEHEFSRLLAALPRDNETRVVVLTGAGRCFSAGGDFDQMQKDIDKPMNFCDSIPNAKFLVYGMLDCPKPFIARINGHAMGLGATMALLCDFTIAAEESRIADPHVKAGFVAGDGGSLLWPQLIGYARAREYLLLGDSLTGREAADIGLITRAVALENLDSAVDEFVQRVLALPPRALQWTKLSVNLGLKQMASTMMDATMAYEGLSNITADHQEAVSAFREKRKPKFTGN